MSTIIDGYKAKKMQKILDAQKDNITSIRDLIGDDDPSFLFYILADKLGYLLSNNPDDCLSETGVKVRKYINKLIKLFGPKFLTNPQVFENRNTLKNSNDITPDQSITLPNEPVIWAANHAFKDDVLASVLAAKRNAYILFGSIPQFYNTFDGVLSWANGVCMANRKLSASRKSSVAKACKAMEMGVDTLIFPEGVWNKTPNQLLINFWPGIYRISTATGAKVVPIVHYLRDPFDKSKDNKIHTVIDEPIKIDGLSEKAALDYLRDVMATWYYLMLEKYGKSTREQETRGYSNSQEAWENYLMRLTQIPDRYDTPIETSADYRPHSIERPEDVWQNVAESNINLNNASHVIYARKLVKENKRNDFQRRF
jgi:1-acyl-sn-glycerol-3-phosphate acyltransferase